MKHNQLRKWTVLIYANGNNEFEPEMTQLLSKAEKVGSDKNINVVIQLGRVSRELVRILRPQEQFVRENNATGVRRYLIEKNCSRYLADLGDINMANPRALYDFICWGMENYPAYNYMLIMGGHCFEYVGIMNDYSHELPYIMGFPEMCKALNLSKKSMGKGIELLVLDTCYINSIEILYELGKEKEHSVNNLLTYIEYGPTAGIPIDRLLGLLKENGLKNNLDYNQLCSKLVQNMDLDLIAFNINQKKLQRIKRSTDDLARVLIQERTISKSFSDIIFKETKPEEPWYNQVKAFQDNLQSLIINYQRVTNQQSPLVSIAHQEASNKLTTYYFRLSFLNNNKWQDLIGKKVKLSNKIETNLQMKPTILPLQALVSLVSVMNPNSSKAEIDKILQELFAYKKWDDFTNYKIR